MTSNSTTTTVCIVYGNCHKTNIGPMQLDWVEYIKYLGVHTDDGKKLSCERQASRRSFFGAFNNIGSHAMT